MCCRRGRTSTGDSASTSSAPSAPAPRSGTCVRSRTVSPWRRRRPRGLCFPRRPAVRRWSVDPRERSRTAHRGRHRRGRCTSGTYLPVPTSLSRADAGNVQRRRFTLAVIRCITEYHSRLVDRSSITQYNCK